MAIEPSLATSWEPLGEDGWRFHLREGVTFHNGATFDATDVLFSYQRASSDASDVASWFAGVSEVVMRDLNTIDFMTAAPNPIFPSSIANFMIMDSGWTSENGAQLPDREGGNFATFNTNGTGPFRLVAREPGQRTELAAHGHIATERTADDHDDTDDYRHAIPYLARALLQPPQGSVVTARESHRLALKSRYAKGLGGRK